MQKSCSTFISFIFFCLYVNAQQVWYFGNGAGLDFNSGIAKPVYSGKIFTLEGCATVCDEKGHLLFYTDGITVWNKFHNIMPNGIGLNGSPSSSQSALIVPDPGNKKKYFIFTTDEKAGTKGLCYSVIDLTHKDGLVLNKNIQLLKSSTEQIIGIRNDKGNGIWVVSHQWNSDKFYVFPVTANGVGEPVISAIGIPQIETSNHDRREAIGYLSATEDGKKIALTICYRSTNNLELFNFNKTTGKLSNVSLCTVNGFPYGVCFSIDNTKLYISFLQGKSGLIQYNLVQKIFTPITENNRTNSFGSLQMGTDRKIYVARTGQYLDVINFPDNEGITCSYKKNAINLAPNGCNFGLPNPVVSVSTASKHSLHTSSSFPDYRLQKVDCSKIIEKPFTKEGQMTMTDISVCANSYLLGIAKNIGATFHWSTNDTTRTITVDSSGVYHVGIFKDRCFLSDSIRIRFRKDIATFRFLPSFNPKAKLFNNEFYYEIDDVRAFDLKVFRRKSKKILFETKNPKIKWNGTNRKGKMVTAGDYNWSVQYKPNCPSGAKPVYKEGVVKVISNK